MAALDPGVFRKWKEAIGSNWLEKMIKTPN
jgi:hypothetical protein